MTPREFRAVIKCHNTTEERTDRRVAALMAFYVNSHVKDSKLTAEDFMRNPGVSHNGHQDPAAVQHAVAKAIDALKTSDNINARKLDPEDPRAKNDREQLTAFLREQGLA